MSAAGLVDSSFAHILLLEASSMPQKKSQMWPELARGKTAQLWPIYYLFSQLHESPNLIAV